VGDGGAHEPVVTNRYAAAAAFIERALDLTLAYAALRTGGTC
jgi:hypothetical protein